MFFSRKDGIEIKDLPLSRKFMPYVSGGRNYSVVYYEQMMDMSKAEQFVEEWNASHPPDESITTFPLILWAVAVGFRDNPQMNRFVAGNKIYQRNGIWLTYSAKKAFKAKSPFIIIKREFKPGARFEDFVKEYSTRLRTERKAKKLSSDKGLNFYLSMPRPILLAMFAGVKFLDFFNLLPFSFIDENQLYCSIFIANLGSLHMESGYHHLYEFGTCPLFMVPGQTKEVPVVEDGQIVIRRLKSVKWSYDERIDDGFSANLGMERVKKGIENPYDLIKEIM